MATLSKKDKAELATAAATVARISAKAAKAAPKKCRKAPTGWKCSRVAGHEGACATRQVKPVTKAKKS